MTFNWTLANFVDPAVQRNANILTYATVLRVASVERPGRNSAIMIKSYLRSIFSGIEVRMALFIRA